MMTPTFFGEITELNSRAIWYSDDEDEEDEDLSEDNVEVRVSSKAPIQITSHELMRSNIQLNFCRVVANPRLTNCIISLSSSSHYKNFRLDNYERACLLGTYSTFGRALVFPISNSNTDECLLWLNFDTSNPSISGQEVAYFTEALRENLYNEFCLNHSTPILILSQQFADDDQLEYLSNYVHPIVDIPFIGRALQPPFLLKSHLESALFEQLTLTLKPALIVCLPDPKNFWFDKASHWPAIPNQIIMHKLNDDNLERTLIFT